jgi:hypothetical protein
MYHVPTTADCRGTLCLLVQTSVVPYAYKSELQRWTVLCILVWTPVVHYVCRLWRSKLMPMLFWFQYAKHQNFQCKRFQLFVSKIKKLVQRFENIKLIQTSIFLHSKLCYVFQKNWVFLDSQIWLHPLLDGC